jgi:hypothetical protein
LDHPAQLILPSPHLSLHPQRPSVRAPPQDLRIDLCSRSSPTAPQLFTVDGEFPST